MLHATEYVNSEIERPKIARCGILPTVSTLPLQIAAKQPRSIAESIDNWQDYYSSTFKLVNLTRVGVSMIRADTKVETYPDNDASFNSEFWSRFIETESLDEFPTLHAHSLLGLWGAFECFIDDLFRATINNNPTLLNEKAFEKITVSASVALNEGLRSQAIDEVLRGVKAKAPRSGTNKFEGVLASVGLAGHIPSRIEKSLRLTHKIRNVWAHQSGLADEKFVNECPQLGYQVGERIKLDADRFEFYSSGLQMYARVIMNRLILKLEPEIGKGVLLTSEEPGYEGCLSEVIYPGWERDKSD